jgi:hypothetical protein
MATELCYGFFPGGDPRKFTPDEGCCTAEEIARWKEDCARWERGELPLTQTRCFIREDREGIESDTVTLVTPSGYGLGSYEMEVEEDPGSDQSANDNEIPWAGRFER